MPVNEFVKPGATIVTNDLTNFLDWLNAGATAAQGTCSANYTGDLASNLSSNNATYHSGYNNGQNSGYDGYNNSYKSGNLNANYSGNNTNYCSMQH